MIGWLMEVDGWGLCVTVLCSGREGEGAQTQADGVERQQMARGTDRLRIIGTKIHSRYYIK